MSASSIVTDSFSSTGAFRKVPYERMRMVKRESICDSFQMDDELPIPELTPGGARIRVCYAGACYTEDQVVNSGQRRPRIPGVHDTSLFPGYEVSGMIDAICETVKNTDLREGDHVILYLTDGEELAEYGYAEFMIIKNLNNLIKLPDDLPLEVAAILPSGALMADSAIQRIKPFIKERLSASKDEIINVLIVGAGGLGLWTLVIAEYYFTADRVRITIADTNTDKLKVAKKQGCYDVIHWDASLHEEYIMMRIQNVCKGGVDAVIDFVSSARTVTRAMKVLKEEGILIVGGNSKYEVPIDLHSLALKRQSLLGIHKGKREELVTLVELVGSKKIRPPLFTVFPLEEANKVFEKLSQGKLSGRAVFQVTPPDYGSSASFFPDDPTREKGAQSMGVLCEEDYPGASLDSLHDDHSHPPSVGAAASVGSPTGDGPVRFHL